MICNRKSEHPIPEPNNNTPTNNENNPNENVGQQPPCGAMDTERHGPVMEDVDEQDGQSQPRSWCFNQGDSEETVASDGTEFMAETQIQLKNVEEIHNEENLRDGKVFMDPEKCPSELEDVEKGKAGVDGADCSLPKAIVTGPVCSDEPKLQEPEEDPENGSEETVSREWRKVCIRDVSDGGMKNSGVKDVRHNTDKPG